MLFSCMPQTGGCEWHGLRGFVVQYNQQFGTNYLRTACLDRELRNEKVPEVLLEAPGERPMVIERKAVAWPLDFFHSHSNEHNLFRYFIDFVDSLGNVFDDAAYLLRVSENSLRRKRKRDVKSIAEHIARNVVLNREECRSPLGMREDKPIVWGFGPALPHEIDERTPERGIGIQIDGGFEDFMRPDRDYKRRRDAALEGYGKEFGRAANDAAAKFHKYSSCRRVLLVQFFGSHESGLTDSDFQELVERASVPERIDQVWIADYDWLNAHDYDLRWMPLG